MTLMEVLFGRVDKQSCPVRRRNCLPAQQSFKCSRKLHYGIVQLYITFSGLQCRVTLWRVTDVSGKPGTSILREESTFFQNVRTPEQENITSQNSTIFSFTAVKLQPPYLPNSLHLPNAGIICSSLFKSSILWPQMRNINSLFFLIVVFRAF